APGLLATADDSTPPPAPAEGAAGADFVFLIGDARDARLLRPQLETQQAVALPVYALSQVFGGRPDAAPLDQDLNGIVFCDVPWMLNPGDTGPLSKNGLQALVERTPENYARLIPMGIDAYNLVSQLSLLKSGPQNRYSGTTGQLNVQDGNRIQRQLSCAQFESGVPQPRGIAPLLQPSASGMATPP
ncbi:MAG: putative lipoprotein, partial [Proteobacteria bacterium]|nr:putative lipoprotein [Pseudomonadota bacterium]